MVTLRTATGREYQSEYFVESVEDRFISFDISYIDPREVNDVFCDPEETSMIEYNGNTYEGYTKFGNIQVFYDSVRVRLDKNGKTN